MLRGMRSRTSQLIVSLVLLICLVCPILEMFDRWDDTARTGNDTEYTFVVLGLCIGVVYTVARFLLELPVLKIAAEHISSRLDCNGRLALAPRDTFFAVPISPPSSDLTLRI
jgi:hypothetical protein